MFNFEEEVVEQKLFGWDQVPLSSLFHFFTGIQEDLYSLEAINNFGPDTTVSFLNIKCFDFVNEHLQFTPGSWIVYNEKLNEKKNIDTDNETKKKNKILRNEIPLDKKLQKEDFIISTKGVPRGISLYEIFEEFDGRYVFIPTNQLIVARPHEEIKEKFWPQYLHMILDAALFAEGKKNVDIDFSNKKEQRYSADIKLTKSKLMEINVNVQPNKDDQEYQVNIFKEFKEAVIKSRNNLNHFQDGFRKLVNDNK